MKEKLFAWRSLLAFLLEKKTDTLLKQRLRN